jgi:hypothetical protein
MKPVWTITLIFLIFIAIGCFGRSLTTREELGAGNGALAPPPLEVLSEQPWDIQGRVPLPAVRSGSPRPTDRDQLQGQEQINSNQAELDNQRREFERLKKRA